VGAWLRNPIRLTRLQHAQRASPEDVTLGKDLPPGYSWMKKSDPCYYLRPAKTGLTAQYHEGIELRSGVCWSGRQSNWNGYRGAIKWKRHRRARYVVGSGQDRASEEVLGIAYLEGVSFDQTCRTQVYGGRCCSAEGIDCDVCSPLFIHAWLDKSEN